MWSKFSKLSAMESSKFSNRVYLIIAGIIVSLVASQIGTQVGKEAGQLSPSTPTENSPLPVADGKILVSVTREETNDLTERHLGMPTAAKVIEDKLVDKLKERTEQAYRADGGRGKYPGTIESQAWSVTVKGKNFVIVKINASGTFQMTSIMGIKNDVFVKVSCAREGIDPVPHSYGACADKMKETFGVSFAP